MKTSIALAGISLAVAVGTAYGQIVTYGFSTDNTGSLGAGVGPGASVTPSAFNTASGLSPASGSPTISGGLATATGFNISGTDNATIAQTQGNYYEFSLTRDGGTSWSLGNLTFDIQGENATGSNAGPDSVSVFLSTTSSSSGFSLLGSTMTGVKGATFPDQSFSSSLSSANSSTAIFFRIVGFNGAGANGDLFIDNVAIGGTAFITPVPEPEHFAAIAGLALVGFGAWRRLAAKKA